jgi:hypothetical protein
MMLKKIIKFCDFTDRVIIKYLLEDLCVGIFSFPAMSAAYRSDMCNYYIKLFMTKRDDTNTHSAIDPNVSEHGCTDVREKHIDI